MGTITKTVQQGMIRFRPKEMKHDKLTWPGWEVAANYLRESDGKSGTSKWRVPVVVQPQMNDDTAAAALTIFGDVKVCFDIVPGISQARQGSSRLESS